MNILVVEDIVSTSWGGAEKSMFAYVKHLKGKGHNIYLTYEKGGDWLKKNNNCLFSGVANIFIGSIGVQGLVAFARNLLSFIVFVKKNKIDLIITHTIHGFFFIGLVKFFYRGPVAIYFKWIYSGLSIGKFNRWGARFITHAIASTSFVKNYWENNNVKPKYGFEIVPNGIEWSDKYARKIVSKPNFINLIFLGRIYKGKGLHILLEGLKNFQHLKLKVYGKFSPNVEHEFVDYHQYLLNYIDENKLNDRVFFLGECDNPLEKILQSDLVVVPSVAAEAQSRVVLEAMATRTLVVASKVGGVPEVLGDEGKKLLFNPTASDLIRRIEEVSRFNDDEYRSVIEKLHNRFISNYTQEITHKRLDEFLKI